MMAVGGPEAPTETCTGLVAARGDATKDAGGNEVTEPGTAAVGVLLGPEALSQARTLDAPEVWDRGPPFPDSAQRRRAGSKSLLDPSRVGRASLIQLVKAWQRTHRCLQEVWHDFVRVHTGRMTYDPSRHDDDALRRFLTVAANGSALHGGGPAHALCEAEAGQGRGRGIWLPERRATWTAARAKNGVLCRAPVENGCRSARADRRRRSAVEH